MSQVWGVLQGQRHHPGRVVQAPMELETQRTHRSCRVASRRSHCCQNRKTSVKRYDMEDPGSTPGPACRKPRTGRYTVYVDELGHSIPDSKC